MWTTYVNMLLLLWIKYEKPLQHQQIFDIITLFSSVQNKPTK